jgi:hypothetical protein
MRLLITNLLATALLLFGAASASAFAVNMTSNYNGVDLLGISDTVTVNVFVDAEVGVNFFSIGVLADSAIFNHVPTPACATTVPTPGCGSPTYILYAPGAGTAAATVLYPQQDPFQSWPAPPPGKKQININMVEANLGTATASGSNIWVASVTWHVFAIGDGTGDITVSITNGGNIVRINNLNVPANQVPVSGSFTVFTPEPTTALLIGLGLVGLGVAGRRRE